MNKWIISSMVLVGLVFAVATAARLTKIEEQVEANGVEQVDVQLRLAVGKFELNNLTGSKGVIAEFEGDYDESKYEYSHTFEHQGRRGTFVFESELVNQRGPTKLEGDENRWEFSFTPEADCRFDIEVGAANAEFDFGDLTVSDMQLDIGAAEVIIDFSTPNRTVLRDLKIDAGACDLEMRNLGNSRFEFLTFDGGMGSFTLDFTGDFDFEAEASIDVGLGSIDIIIPEDIGVRIEAEEHWFNSIDFPKKSFSKVRGDDDVWESDNFKTAKGRLTLVLDVGMGSADISFR
ncbi:MAG: hypothetical protein IPH59_06225 [bacterium]|nr:hypothetical protein [bacterium]